MVSPLVVQRPDPGLEREGTAQGTHRTVAELGLEPVS